MRIKISFAGVLALLIMWNCGPTMRAESTEANMDRFMENPREVRNIGDPFILREGEYHLFATGETAGFLTWSSGDLVHFERSRAMKKTAWASKDYWAPEVYAWQGRYVMFFTARRQEDASLRIGIAVSDHPEGPYEDPLGGPLFDFGYAAIDATMFTDDAGTPYLVYSRDCSENIVNGRHESHLYGVRLADDLMSTVGQPVLLTQPDQFWETLSGDYRWNEGPSVIRHEGKYYLFYSANYYASREYAVGVAVADSPLGPYRKQENNPILRWVGSDENVLVSGPGHNSFFTVGDELFSAYHTHTFPDRPSGNRRLNIDRAGFHYDGTAYINGPTRAPQLRPLEDIGCVNLIPRAVCEGDPRGLLRDGDICQAASSAAYVWQGNTVSFSWDGPVRADLLLIYPALGERITGTVDLDGRTVSFDFEPQQPGECFTASFEETDLTNLRISLDRGNLGEVMLIGPREGN